MWPNIRDRSRCWRPASLVPPPARQERSQKGDWRGSQRSCSPPAISRAAQGGADRILIKMIGLPEIERPPPSYPPANPIEQLEPEIKGAFEIPSPRGTAGLDRRCVLSFQSTGPRSGHHLRTIHFLKFISWDEV
jgi:hypothetical protein